MTDRPETDLAIRRKRLRFRAWHRGMREMDLILGRFADRHLAGFDAAALLRFEELLERPDPELFAWLTGEAAVPAAQDSVLVRQLIEFSRSGMAGEGT